VSYDNGGTLPTVGLERISKPSDEVRVPEVPRGTAVVVTRYREEVAKVVVVNPEDLAMLEHSHELLGALDQLSGPEVPSDAELTAMATEDRREPEKRVEDAERIAAILRL
jgi:hypothetical protein